MRERRFERCSELLSDFRSRIFLRAADIRFEEDLRESLKNLSELYRRIRIDITFFSPRNPELPRRSRFARFGKPVSAVSVQTENRTPNETERELRG